MPITKKSPFAPWANAILTFLVDDITAGIVTDPRTGNKSYAKKPIVLKCLLNVYRSRKGTDVSSTESPGADTARAYTSGYLVEPFLPAIPTGIEHNDIADCVLQVKDAKGTILQTKVGKFKIEMAIVNSFRAGVVTGCPVYGEFYIP